MILGHKSNISEKADGPARQPANLPARGPGPEMQHVSPFRASPARPI